MSPGSASVAGGGSVCLRRPAWARRSEGRQSVSASDRAAAAI